MANTSRYFNIDDQFLMEWVYTDIGTPEIIDDTTAPIYLLKNSDTNQQYLYNADGSENQTGNTRDRSAVLISKSESKWAGLNIDLPLSYNNYNANLTNDAGLLTPLIPAVSNIAYDTVRIHIVSGYNFQNLEGFIFEIKYRKKTLDFVSVASLAYLKSDNYATINPKPFLMGERLYSTYIEIKVPSLLLMIQDQNLYPNPHPNETELLSYKLTEGSKLLDSANIYINFEKIRSVTVNNGFQFFNTIYKTEFSIPKFDEFSNIIAKIEESLNGDFLELSAREIVGSNENFIEDWIFRENSKPEGEWIVIHDYSIFEQVGYNLIKTSNKNFIQEGNYDRPIIERPVIMNYDAVSWIFDYTIKLFNKANNQMIIKRSTQTFYNSKKYGRFLPKLNLGTIPVQEKIYNVIKDIKLQYTPVLSNTEITTKYISNFFNQHKISVSYNYSVQEVSSKNFKKQKTDTSEIFKQGELTISLSMYDNYLNFTIYNNVNDANQFLNLSELGLIYINFINDSGEEVKILNTVDQSINPSRGDILFKINADNSKKVLGFTDKSFHITIKGDSNSDETLLYSGKFESKSLMSDAKSLVGFQNRMIIQNNQQKNTIKSKDKEIEDLKKQIELKDLTIKQNNENIAKLNTKVFALENNLTVSEASLQNIEPAKANLEEMKRNLSDTRIFNPTTNIVDSEKSDDKSLLTIIKNTPTAGKNMKVSGLPLRGANLDKIK